MTGYVIFMRREMSSNYAYISYRKKYLYYEDDVHYCV